MFRNRALAKIMSRADRPARPKVERDTSRSKSTKRESPSIPAFAHAGETSTKATRDYEDGKSKGDRLIEKLLRSGPIGPNRGGETKAESKPVEMVQVHVSPPMVATSRATTPVIGLERIEEQTQEGHESDSVAPGAVLPDVSQYRCEQEESAAVKEPIGAPKAVELPDPVPSILKTEIAAEPANPVRPELELALSSRPKEPVNVEEEDNVVVEEKIVKPEDSSSQITSTIVDKAPEPITPSAPVTPLAQRLEEQWEDVETEQAVIDSEPTKPVSALK